MITGPRRAPAGASPRRARAAGQDHGRAGEAAVAGDHQPQPLGAAAEHPGPEQQRAREHGRTSPGAGRRGRGRARSPRRRPDRPRRRWRRRRSGPPPRAPAPDVAAVPASSASSRRSSALARDRRQRQPGQPEGDRGDQRRQRERQRWPPAAARPRRPARARAASQRGAARRTARRPPGRGTPPSRRAMPRPAQRPAVSEPRRARQQRQRADGASGSVRSGARTPASERVRQGGVAEDRARRLRRPPPGPPRRRRPAGAAPARRPRARARARAARSGAGPPTPAARAAAPAPNATRRASPLAPPAGAVVHPGDLVGDVVGRDRAGRAVDPRPQVDQFPVGQRPPAAGVAGGGNGGWPSRCSTQPPGASAIARVQPGEVRDRRETARRTARSPAARGPPACAGRPRLPCRCHSATTVFILSPSAIATQLVACVRALGQQFSTWRPPRHPWTTLLS